MSKLPNSLQLEVARKSTNEIWKIDELLETIRREIEVREASHQVKLHDSRPPPNIERDKNQHATVQAFLSKQNQGDSMRICCAYCNEQHYSASCERATGLQDRKDILRRDEHCFICLRTGPVSQECQNSRGCRKCGHRHHQSICTRGNLPKPPEKPQDTPEPLNQTRPGDPPETTTATNATGSSLKGNPVLLQTAQCVAANADTTRSTTVRVLFDTGSQRTYITNSLKSRLGLKPIERESLRLSTFGNDRVRKESCDIVKLSLRKGEGESVDIAALNFPVICSSLPLQVDVSAYPHIEGLPLADEFSGQEHDSIDVLIGSDQYWNFITGETVRGGFVPTAVSSKLGWLLSGPNGGATTNSVDTFTTNLIISGESGRCISSGDDELKSTLKQFWETESIGIREPEDSSINQLSRSFLKNIKYEDSRYEVSLPWKEEKMDVPTDYNYCYNRLRSLIIDNSSNEKSVKVLGSNWNTHSDELFFDFEDLITYAKLLPITKRALLKLSAKIFDPLGFLSPFTIGLKVMFQILCCEQIDWDKELHRDSRDMFNSFVTDLQHLSNIMVPRCYFDVSSKPKNIQLNGFSDKKAKYSLFRTSGSPYSCMISGNNQGIFVSSTGYGNVLLDRLYHCPVLDKEC